MVCRRWETLNSACSAESRASSASSFLLEANPDDLGSRIDQAAEGGGALDDPAVVLDVDGSGDDVEERREIADAADIVERAAPLELVGEREEVGWLAAVVEVEDRLVDRAVGGDVEIFGAHDTTRRE